MDLVVFAMFLLPLRHKGGAKNCRAFDRHKAIVACVYERVRVAGLNLQ